MSWFIVVYRHLQPVVSYNETNILILGGKPIHFSL